MAAQTKVTGIEETNRKLGLIAQLATPELLQQGLFKSADTMREAMDAALTPHKRIASRGPYVIIYKARDGRVLVGPPKDKYYLYFLEAGRSNQPARPVMRPAAEAVRPGTIKKAKAEILKLFTEQVKRRIGKIAPWR